jgi:hypothetical protein
MQDIAGSEGLQWAIVRAIVSPHFHQLLELDSTPTGDGRRRIDAFAVASRLAFGLTGALPDEQLLSAAQAGELSDLTAVRAQAERLMQGDLARDRARRLLRDWLVTAPPDPLPILRAETA